MIDDKQNTLNVDAELKSAPPQSKEDLLRRYALGERYFANCDLPEGTDLRGADLQDAVFLNANLNSIYFCGANLQRVDFANADVKCSDFRNSKLDGAVFSGASVEAADFSGADVDNTSFEGARYYGIILKAGEVP